MNIRRLLRAPLLLALPLAFVVGACAEDLESGGACPALCPGQQLDILDTVFTAAVTFDTTIVGLPLTGFERNLLLASRQDTLDVRAAIRFDTLTRVTAAGAAITRVDEAMLDIRLSRTQLPLPLTFFIDAYDIGDSTLVDSLPLTLLPLFEPGRLLGTLRIDTPEFDDTAVVRIPLDTARVLDIIEDSARVMRIGLRVRSDEPVEFRVLPVDSGNRGPVLRYRISADETVPVIENLPKSASPSSPLFVAFDYMTYSIIALAPDPGAPGRLTVGGMPGRRPYLRFDLPIWLTDSSTVLLAELELVQDPIRGLDDTVTTIVRPQVVLAGHAVTDLRRAAGLLADFGAFVFDSLMLTPGDSGVHTLNIRGALTQWRTLDGVRPLPSALVLRTSRDGESALAVRFFGIGADPSLRPRLRVSYVPDTSFTFGRP